MRHQFPYRPHRYGWLRKKKRKFLISMVLIFLLGCGILFLTKWMLWQETKEGDSLEKENMEEEMFRSMDFGSEGFGRLLTWAEQEDISAGEALSVWMSVVNYDLGGISVEKWSRQEYESCKAEIQAKQGGCTEKTWSFSEKARIYDALAKDLRVFPIPRNTDPACAYVSYENGWGDPRTFGGERRHEGTDIMGDQYPDGTYPVLSMTNGIVEKIGWLKLGGWRIGIRSENGLYCYYAHMDSYAAGLEMGSIVKAGDVIGYMGSTGYSTIEGTKGNFAVHLHVGIYVPAEGQEDVSINPYYLMKYLEKEHTVSMTYEWMELPSEESESGAVMQ